MQVQQIAELQDNSLVRLLARYAMQLHMVPLQQAIPGSHWGDSEAGLIDSTLYVRPDTPVHSALHETCHYICMDQARRQQLHTDAGGDYAEENAVCYLQILLADFIDGSSQQRMMQDMDDWGYSFRLGSARAWFDNDADDARQWLLDKNILNRDNSPTWLTNL